MRLLLALACLLSLASCRAQETAVYFIPTLHGYHKINEAYSYESLRSLLDSLQPGVIAVEIRPEDVGADSAYLAANYPFEMRMPAWWFPEATIEGMDWLGDDLGAGPIPENYWKEVSAIKKHEAALRADSTWNARRANCDSLALERLDLLTRLSLRDLMASDDARLTRAYYRCLAEQLEGSVHTRILDFYDRRNEEILGHIMKIIDRHPGKVIVILTGDDHYALLKDRFRHDSIYP